MQTDKNNNQRPNQDTSKMQVQGEIEENYYIKVIKQLQPYNIDDVQKFFKDVYCSENVRKIEIRNRKELQDFNYCVQVLVRANQTLQYKLQYNEPQDKQQIQQLLQGRIFYKFLTFSIQRQIDRTTERFRQKQQAEKKQRKREEQKRKNSWSASVRKLFGPFQKSSILSENHKDSFSQKESNNSVSLTKSVTTQEWKKTKFKVDPWYPQSGVVKEEEDVETIGFIKRNM